ncbi:cupin domain-containing protein [Aduncisulcus paluster]|uniref:Cupin domain-containing protein n=1 Tax=Aduncisulcus paluster TaxID=2918883 RepID=A0ABQ5KU96_9EUKA|nr:cupin domain-containing protein [Aduncisulcus paluster]
MDIDPIFPLGIKNEAYKQYFIGDSYLSILSKDIGLLSFNVTFEPGCRNNWHVHHKGGQVLFCTAGFGWYQEEGKPPRLLKPGDVVEIPAGTNHWHGATKDSWFSHIAINVPAKDGTVEWKEPVTDEEYAKLKE